MKGEYMLKLVLMLALVGCGGKDPVSSDSEKAASEHASRMPASAVGREWVLEAFVSGEEVTPVAKGTRVSLMLSEDGRVSGSTGCNQYGGSYVAVDSAAVSVDELAATEMACLGDGIMDQESRYLRGLAAATTMVHSGDEFRVYHGEGNQYLRFVAAGEDSQGGIAPPDPIAAHEDTVWLADGMLRYTVHPCFKDSIATRSSPEPVVVVEGNDLYFHLEILTYCNALTDQALHLEPVIDEGQITLNAIFRGPAVRCLCSIPVRGVVEGLKEGTYAVTAVYGVELQDGTHLEPEILYETEVRVGGASAVGPDTDPEPLPADLRLSAREAGTTIELSKPGAIVEIALEANPSTGYRWEVVRYDSTILGQLDELFQPGADSLVGAPGIQRLYFEARAPGQTTLHLAYSRPWESVPPAATFEVSFIVNGGIVPPPVAPLGIRLGNSFGECLGYCWQEMILDEESMVLISRGWDQEAFPEKMYREDMDPDLWRWLLSVADFAILDRMDEVYGCPDCADGGAEWVTMNLSGRMETVKFEYGAKLEPIGKLLELLREVRDGLVKRSGS